MSAPQEGLGGVCTERGSRGMVALRWICARVGDVCASASGRAPVVRAKGDESRKPQEATVF